MQCMSSPARQAWHSPQVITGWTITASPGFTERTPGPTSSTQPAFSWPRMYGSSTSTFSFQMPSMMCRSVRQSPAPPTRTITSDAPCDLGRRDVLERELRVVRGEKRRLHAATSLVRHSSRPSP